MGVNLCNCFIVFSNNFLYKNYFKEKLLKKYVAIGFFLLSLLLTMHWNCLGLFWHVIVFFYVRITTTHCCLTFLTFNFKNNFIEILKNLVLRKKDFNFKKLIFFNLSFFNFLIHFFNIFNSTFFKI